MYVWVKPQGSVHYLNLIFKTLAHSSKNTFFLPITSYSLFGRGDDFVSGADLSGNIYFVEYSLHSYIKVEKIYDCQTVMISDSIPLNFIDIFMYMYASEYYFRKSELSSIFLGLLELINLLRGPLIAIYICKIISANTCFEV